MSWNGAGVYQINTAGQPVVSGTVISASVFNTLTADIASGISNCITKDGQQTVTANIPMGTYKFTGLGYGTSATDSARIDNCNVLNMCEFRLTGQSGVPVTTSDVTGITTIYFTPYKGNRIALYDGSKWVMRTSTELSIDVPDAGLPYDVFVYDNAGVPALELSDVWLTNNIRTNALTFQDGVYVKSGAATRRYVGTFKPNTTGAGQTEDSMANRHIWNYYNRVARPMRKYTANASWTYTTDTWRQADNNTANQVSFIVGIAEDYTEAAAVLSASSSTTGTSTAFYAGVGLDSSASIASGSMSGVGSSAVVSAPVFFVASVRTIPDIGYHEFRMLERSAATGTTTWYGSYGGGSFVGGIHGVVFA